MLVSPEGGYSASIAASKSLRRDCSMDLFQLTFLDRLGPISEVLQSQQA